MKILYCKQCQKGTQHQALERTGFFTQAVIAILSRFTADLREHDYECTNCGTKRN